jgi:hypothetical protein
VVLSRVESLTREVRERPVAASHRRVGSQEERAPHRGECPLLRLGVSTLSGRARRRVGPSPFSRLGLYFRHPVADDVEPASCLA